MANDISANPWKLDTPGAGVIYAFPVKIKNIVWANYAAAATLVLQDVNGKDIINATAPGVGQSWNFGEFNWVRGIKMPTLSSGELTIAIGAGK